MLRPAAATAARGTCRAPLARLCAWASARRAAASAGAAAQRRQRRAGQGLAFGGIERRGERAPPPAAATGKSRDVFTSAAVGQPSASDAALEGKEYGAGQIRVLEGLEPVRLRPGMYIGSTGPRGLHHLVYEIVDNAVDEVQAGEARSVRVTLHGDGSASVRDDGRGIPTDVHPATGMSGVETVFTKLHAGGKFGGEQSGYSVSGGLHGVGASVTNALSEKLEVTVWRKGSEHRQEYERGVPLGAQGLVMAPMPEGLPKDHTGTLVRFWPDPQIFTTTTRFEPKTIGARLRELAFLNERMTVIFETEKPAKEKVFHYPAGLGDYMAWLTRDHDTLHEQPVVCSGEVDGIGVTAVLQWCGDAYSDTLLGYANSIRTTDGGVHLDALKAAVAKTVNAAARAAGKLKENDGNLSSEHVREGLTAVVSVRVPNPEFEGQTKTRLGNPEARRAVDAVVSEALGRFLGAQVNKGALENIVAKASAAARAAEAAKRARDLVRRKTVLKSTTLPGKLSDCSERDRESTEIFIVEGDSAGGSTKQGRDRRTQAVLPLRGKILNVERADDEKMYKNQEIKNLITALGLGIKGEDFKEDAMRYGKIIILTDADVDGAHIRTLLLTFLFRYQRALFELGRVYVGVPPLYKVTSGKSEHYCYSDNELSAYLPTLGGARYTLQRFKGLGEMMPQQLWDTTLDPSRRKLKRLTVEDVAEAHDTISLIMGPKVIPRKELIVEAAAGMDRAELDI